MRSRHVFISYVRENQSTVDRLYKDLKTHGVKVWLDRQEIEPGMKWKNAIRGAIRQGDFFIACFSKEYTSRPKAYMNEELVLAIEELRKIAFDRIWFIPVLLSNCVIPPIDIGAGQSLADIQWLELYQDWDAGIQKIIKIIQPIPHDVQTLIDAIHTPNIDTRVRCQAIDELGKRGDTVAAPALLEALKIDEEPIYFYVIESLSQIGGDLAIDGLIKELHIQAPSGRKRIADALRKSGPAASLRLLKGLSDEDHDARKRAQFALVRIGDRSIISSLVDKLKDKDPDVRKRSAYILAEIGNASAVPALNDALSDKNLDVRYGVVAALQELGNTSSLPALNKALKAKENALHGRISGIIRRINRNNTALGAGFARGQQEEA